jgi:hypothetical protein
MSSRWFELAIFSLGPRRKGRFVQKREVMTMGWGFLLQGINQSEDKEQVLLWCIASFYHLEGAYFSSGGHTVLSGSCELEREITPNSLEVHRRVSLTPDLQFGIGIQLFVGHLQGGWICIVPTTRKSAPSREGITYSWDSLVSSVFSLGDSWQFIISSYLLYFGGIISHIHPFSTSMPNMLYYGMRLDIFLQ